MRPSQMRSCMINFRVCAPRYPGKLEFTVTVRADFPVHGRSALPEIQPRLQLTAYFDAKDL